MSDINSPKVPRPQSVGRFELLAWLSLVLIVCDIILYVILNRDQIFLVDDDAPVGLVEGAIGIFMIVSLLISPVPIFAAARRQYNWARWFYGVLVAIDVVAMTAALFLPEPFMWTDFVLSVFSLAASVAAVYFVFSRESAAWFSRPAPDPALAKS
jgi:hypothetical protein